MHRQPNNLEFYVQIVVFKLNKDIENLNRIKLQNSLFFRQIV
jgi:hypothetical protein